MCGFKISKMILKTIFTWWNKQTVGTFIKTIFTGKYVGKDNFGNKYYKNNEDKRWVIYSKDIEATKIPSDWYLWMHYTTNKIPDKIEKKYNWQKDHAENRTGTNLKHQPTKIKKNSIKKKYETWK